MSHKMNHFKSALIDEYIIIFSCTETNQTTIYMMQVMQLHWDSLGQFRAHPGPLSPRSFELVIKSIPYILSPLDSSSIARLLSYY